MRPREKTRFNDLQEGATYTVRFRAKADASRLMGLSGQIDHWQGVGDSIGLSKYVPLTPEWQSYQYEFQAKKVAAENAIHFNVGNQTGTVWIADFSLTTAVK